MSSLPSALVAAQARTRRISSRPGSRAASKSSRSTSRSLTTTAVPIRGLRPRDFVVEVDGLRRRVISADGSRSPRPVRRLHACRTLRACTASPACTRRTRTPCRGVSSCSRRSHEHPLRGDERATGPRSEGFVDGLQPSDRLSVVASGLGSAPSVPFTTGSRACEARAAVDRRASVAWMGHRPLSRPARTVSLALKPIEAPKTIVLDL